MHADIKITEKQSGGLVWGFYVPLGQDLHGLNRIAITTKGDYILENEAVGYIDNVEMAVYREVIPTVETTVETTVHHHGPDNDRDADAESDSDEIPVKPAPGRGGPGACGRTDSRLPGRTGGKTLFFPFPITIPGVISL